MDEIDWVEQRKPAIHLLRSGRTLCQLTDELGRHISWAKY